MRVGNVSDYISPLSTSSEVDIWAGSMFGRQHGHKKELFLHFSLQNIKSCADARVEVGGMKRSIKGRNNHYTCKQLLKHFGNLAIKETNGIDENGNSSHH